MSFGDDTATYLAVAAGVLGEPVEAILDLVDFEALDGVLTEVEQAARRPLGRDALAKPLRPSLHRQAAVLLVGLVRRRPLAGTTTRWRSQPRSSSWPRTA